MKFLTSLMMTSLLSPPLSSFPSNLGVRVVMVRRRITTESQPQTQTTKLVIRVHNQKNEYFHNSFLSIYYSLLFLCKMLRSIKNKFLGHILGNLFPKL